MSCHLLFLLTLLGPFGETSAPGFDQFGNAHQLENPGADLIIVDFAASWCKPCWKALPRLQALSERYPRLKILVASQDRDAAGRDRLVRELGLTIPVIWDKENAWAERFQPKGMPATFVVSGDGKVLYQTVGESTKSWEALLQFVTSLLRQGP